MKRLLILAVLSLCAGQAEAQSSPFTAKALFDWCTSDQRSERYFNCLLYVTGFLNGFNVGITPADGPDNSSLLCLPSALTPADAAYAFVRGWRSSTRGMEPSKLDAVSQEIPQVALSFQLMRAYPCKNSN